MRSGTMLLALDSATSTASLALYDLEMDTLLAEWTWQARRRHTQDMLAALHALLTQQGLAMADLSACAVTTGPGSFTGVRIGVSLIKGIALGLEAETGAQRPRLRVLGVPTLSVTAAPWLPLLDASTRLCAYIQAGRGRYNWVWFEAGDGLRCPGAQEHVAGDAAALAAAVQKTLDTATGAGTAPGVWLAGEADAPLASAVASLPRVRLLDATTALRRAGHLARFAARRLAQEKPDQAPDPAQELAALQPIYLTPA